MLRVHRHQLAAALQGVGLQAGDHLLVHSAIQYLGQPEGGVGLYLQAIRDVAGPDCTVAVPTFNFSFARGERYDPQTTPSIGMGAFSEYIRQLPEARRTPHPMQSLAAVGRYAADLAGRDTPSAFDPGSAFERMLELGFKILLLGADARAVSVVHYSEQRADVPYRYWKDFKGEVLTPTGWQARTYRMFVRDEKINPQLTADPFENLLRQRRQWRQTTLNYGAISICTVNDMVSALDDLLAADPWAIVANRQEAFQRFQLLKREPPRA